MILESHSVILKFISLMLLPLFFACSFAWADTNTSDALSSSEYGTLYVLENLEKQNYSWRTGLNYGFEFGNPYNNVFGAGLNLECALGRFVWLGVQATKYHSSESALMTALGKNLSDKGIDHTFLSPTYSVFPIVTLVPLSGHLSVLGHTPLELELNIRMGFGRTFYGENAGRNGVLWSILPILKLTQRWGLQMAVSQEIESPLDEENRMARTRGELGVSLQF